MGRHTRTREVGIVSIAPFLRDDLSIGALGLYALVSLLPDEKLAKLSVAKYPAELAELEAAGLAENLGDNDWLLK